jgi:hypothetical protein
MQKVRILLVLTLLWAWASLYGQLPKTALHIVELKNLYNNPTVLDVSYVSNFNDQGYNNQPCFIQKDKLLMTVGIDTSNYTDIYELDLKNHTYNRVTDTQGIGEYSPMMRPGTQQITTVRAEKDGKTQSLYAYPYDRSSIGNRLIRSIGNVGYYHWINTDTIAMFLVTEPAELVLVDIKSNLTEKIAIDVGRCLKLKDDILYFVEKKDSLRSKLMMYDIRTKTKHYIIDLPIGSEDFDILAGGDFLAGDKGTLMILAANHPHQWRKLIDLTSNGISKITRIHNFQDRIAVVTSHE